MTAALTRRAALAGTAVAALGLGAPAVFAAATPHSAAAALREEADQLSREYRESMREADAAFDATPEVKAPEALFARNGDGVRLWMRSPIRSFVYGRLWYGDADLVAEMRAATFRRLDGIRDETAAARRDEIVVGWDAWQGAIKAAEDASGYTAAQARFDAAHDAYAAFRLRLVEVRSADPEVLAVKTTVIADLIRDKPSGLDSDIAWEVKHSFGARENALALSLARDLLGMLAAGVGGAA